MGQIIPREFVFPMLCDVILYLSELKTVNLMDLINFLTLADNPLVGLISNLMAKRIMGLSRPD